MVTYFVAAPRWHPMQRISWAFNLELDRNVLPRIILSKCQSSRSVEIHSNVEILSKVHCVTHVIKAINLSAPCTSEPNNEQYYTWQIAWHCLNFQTRKNTAQKVVSTDGIRVNLAPFAPSADLPPWLLMNLFIQSCMKCIRRVIQQRNPSRPLPEIEATCLKFKYYGSPGVSW